MRAAVGSSDAPRSASVRYDAPNTPRSDTVRAYGDRRSASHRPGVVDPNRCDAVSSTRPTRFGVMTGPRTGMLGSSAPMPRSGILPWSISARRRSDTSSTLPPKLRRTVGRGRGARGAGAPRMRAWVSNASVTDLYAGVSFAAFDAYGSTSSAVNSGLSISCSVPPGTTSRPVAMSVYGSPYAPAT